MFCRNISIFLVFAIFGDALRTLFSSSIWSMNKYDNGHAYSDIMINVMSEPIKPNPPQASQKPCTPCRAIYPLRVDSSIPKIMIGSIVSTLPVSKYNNEGNIISETTAVKITDTTNFETTLKILLHLLKIAYRFENGSWSFSWTPSRYAYCSAMVTRNEMNATYLAVPCNKLPNNFATHDKKQFLVH